MVISAGYGGFVVPAASVQPGGGVGDEIRIVPTGQGSPQAIEDRRDGVGAIRPGQGFGELLRRRVLADLPGVGCPELDEALGVISLRNGLLARGRYISPWMGGLLGGLGGRREGRSVTLGHVRVP